ncbi:hypothetical protein B0E53_06632 [Micromonospora sp. MH33]|nr:hypothetical protein B0E53_06632 [Micromonospora sp. MH33]
MPLSRWSARRLTAVSSADGVFAETCSRWAGRIRRSARYAAGASSSTTCALVPPMPNELTPARRGPPSVSHLVSVFAT